MTELITSRIRGHAAKLGLTHLADNLTDLATRADAGNLGYLEFLDLICEEEIGVREARRYRSALHMSGLPHHKTLDEFDFAFQPDLDLRRVRDLATLAFLEDHTNIALLGPPGTGKTHLAVALAVAACQAGHGVYFATLNEIVRKLRAADHAGRLIHQLRVYQRPALLVIDEIGYLTLDRADANLVFQLIARRYERGSIILTSNKTFAEWGAVFADDVLATAILDRVLHHCEVIIINGPSYRLKDRLLNTPEPATTA